MLFCLLKNLAGLAMVLGLAATAPARAYVMSEAEFATLIPGERDEFDYVNPRETATACGLPLTTVEKIAQQAGLDPGDWRLFGHPVLTGNSRANLRVLWRQPAILRRLPLIHVARLDAEALQRRHFPKPTFRGVMDEADALRHLSFASLLSLRAGPKLARQVLRAHERYQRSLDSLMDRYNNRSALALVERRRTEWSRLSAAELEDALVNEARAMMSDGRLVVVAPVLTETPPPPSEFYRFARDLLRRPLE